MYCTNDKFPVQQKKMTTPKKFISSFSRRPPSRGVENSNGPIFLRSRFLGDSKSAEASNGVTYGDNLFKCKAEFEGALATCDLVAMAEKGDIGMRAAAARSKPSWLFSTRMRLSELDTLGEGVGEAEYAFLAENVRSEVEVCEK